MRLFYGILLIFTTISCAGFGQVISEDSYSESLVATLANRTTPVLSMQEKAVNRLGDRAAIGLIRHLGPLGSPDSHAVEGVLFVVRMAFAAPEVISTDANRQPKATLLLLSYLSCQPALGSLREEIEQARIYVLHQVEEYKQKHGPK